MGAIVLVPLLSSDRHEANQPPHACVWCACDDIENWFLAADRFFGLGGTQKMVYLKSPEKSELQKNHFAVKNPLQR